MKRDEASKGELESVVIETCLSLNNNKAYQLLKELTKKNQGRSATTQDKAGKCLIDEHAIRHRWTEYCSELYNNNKKKKAAGDTAVHTELFGR